MGKTVESYRMALEPEINRWSGFARALRKPDREAFDELMDMCRINAMAAGNACNPVIFEPMVMSILLGQEKKLTKLERKLKVFDKPKDNLPDEPKKEPQLYPKNS